MSVFVVWRIPRPAIGSRGTPELIGAIDAHDADNACTAAASLSEQLGTYVAVQGEVRFMGGETPDVTPSGLMRAKAQLQATVVHEDGGE
jgi:hypothetical protein